MTCEYASYPALLVEADIQQKIDPNFLPNGAYHALQRVVLELSFAAARIFQELRAVQCLDRLLSGNTRRRHLASTGKPCHQVRLNEPREDL